MTLSNYLPHIHATGNELVVCTSNVAAVPEIVLKRAQSFVLNTSYYLANRREVRQIDWTEMGRLCRKKLHGWIESKVRLKNNQGQDGRDY